MLNEANPNIEFRNSKQFSNYQNPNVPNIIVKRFIRLCFEHLEIRISNLFRISCFRFRIFVIRMALPVV